MYLANNADDYNSKYKHLYDESLLETDAKTTPPVALRAKPKKFDYTREEKAKNFLNSPPYEKADRSVYDRTPSGGADCPAAWQGARFGNVSARVAARVGQSKTYEDLARASERARTASAVRKTYGDLRWHGKIRCRPDTPRFAAADRDAAQKFYRKTKYWQLSPQYIDEKKAARRYLIIPEHIAVTAAHLSTFRKWRNNHPSFPPPIKFAEHKAPTGEWWDLSVLCAWERPRCLPRDWEVVAKRLGLNPPSRHIFALSGEPLNVVSNAAEARSKKTDARKPTTEKVVFLLPEEERELIQRAKTGDRVAINKMILAYRPLIWRIARERATSSLSSGDLAQQAIVGTQGQNGEIQNGFEYALRKFEPEKGAFSGFVQQSIVWAIADYLKKNRSLEGLSLNARINPDSDDDDAPTWQDHVIREYDEDNIADEEFFEWRPALVAALRDSLNNRERSIFEAYYLVDRSPSLEALGRKFNISGERVRQILARALAKVKKAILAGGVAA